MRLSRSAPTGLLIADAELAAAGGRAVAKSLAAAISLLSGVDMVLTGQAGLTDGAAAWRRGSPPSCSPVVLDAVGLSHVSAGELMQLWHLMGAVLIPLAAPVVVAIAPGPAPIRPRYRYPARIANAWQLGLVEICTPRELGLDAEALAPDIESDGSSCRLSGHAVRSLAARFRKQRSSWWACCE